MWLQLIVNCTRYRNVVVRYLMLFAVVNVALFPYAWETRNKGKGIRYELDP